MLIGAVAAAWVLGRQTQVELQTAFVALFAIFSILAGLAAPYLWLPGFSVLGLYALVAPGLSVSKLLFFTLVLILIGIALILRSSREQFPALLLADTLLPISLMTGLLLAVSVLVAMRNGVGISDWASSSTSYLLFAAFPPLVIVTTVMGKSRLQKMFMISTGLGALAYILTWAENRGFLFTRVDDYLFPASASFQALYYYSISRVVFSRKNSVVWMMLTALLLAGLFLTGNRNSLVHLSAFLTVPVLAFRGNGDVPRLAMAKLISVSLALLIVGSVLVKILNVDARAIAERYASLGSLLSAGSGDESRTLREQHAMVAWNVFRDHPLIGAGPGINVQQYWSALGAVPIWFEGKLQYPDVIYDTSLAWLANFGIIGLVAVGAVGMVTLHFMRSLELSPAAVALKAWLLTMAVSVIFSFPLDDRSLIFGLFPLAALAATETSENRGKGGLRSPKVESGQSEL